jgi:hypothetical protein
MSTCLQFSELLQAFFTDRLMHQRQASPNTIASYRDTFRLLLQFAQQKIGKALPLVSRSSSGRTRLWFSGIDSFRGACPENGPVRFPEDRCRYRHSLGR